MARVLADNVALNYTGTNPYAACTGTAVLDAGGNNNGRIDPGESADLTATIKNIGGVDFTNFNTTLECSDSYITVTDNGGYFGSIAVDSSKENSADPYTISASSATPPGHVAYFRLIATEAAFVDTFEFSLVIGSYHYLLWNPDDTPEPGMKMDSILTALGYTGQYSITLPSGADLGMYCAIFVCVGIYPANYVISTGSAEATALVNYLNSNGRMYLEGGDLWYYDPLGSGYNFCPLFGITAVADGSNDLGPVVGENSAFTEGMNFFYTGENSFIDHINPTGTGFLIFHDGNNSYNCGVANDANAGYKTVGTSFELGALVDAGGVSTRAALLDSIMHFFGITTGVEEITKLELVTPTLTVSPNPFTSTTNIRYSILDSRFSTEKSTMRIYDATGRLVKSFDLASSIENLESVLTWNGTDDRGRRLPAGVYMLMLETANVMQSHKIVLVE